MLINKHEFESSTGLTLPQHTEHVMEVAAQEATKFLHPYVGTEHLTLACIKEDEVVKDVLGRLGVTDRQVRIGIEFVVGRGTHYVAVDQLSLTQRGQRMLTLGAEEAKRLDDREFLPKHMILGLCRLAEGIGAAALERCASLDRIRFGLLNPGEIVPEKLQ